MGPMQARQWRLLRQAEFLGCKNTESGLHPILTVATWPRPKLSELRHLTCPGRAIPAVHDRRGVVGYPRVCRTWCAHALTRSEWHCGVGEGWGWVLCHAPSVSRLGGSPLDKRPSRSSPSAEIARDASSVHTRTSTKAYTSVKTSLKSHLCLVSRVRRAAR